MNSTLKVFLFSLLGLLLAFPLFAGEAVVTVEKEISLAKSLKLQPIKKTSQNPKKPELKASGIQQLTGKVRVSLSRGMLTYAVPKDEFRAVCHAAKLFIKDKDGKLSKLSMKFSSEGGRMGTKPRYRCRSNILTQPLNRELHFIASLTDKKYSIKSTHLKAQLVLDEQTNVNFIFQPNKRN